MNFRDFEIARRKERTRKRHKALHKKLLERPLSRPRATKNITSSDPRLQGIQFIKRYYNGVLILF